MKILAFSGLSNILTSPQGKKLLTTVNADIYRMIRSDPLLKEIVFRNLVCIDGRPLHAFAKLFARDVELVQGSALIFELARYAGESGESMLIIGGRQDVNTIAVTTLQEKYGCEIYGFAPDYVNNDTLTRARDLIIQCKIKFVFVCLGAPRQETVADSLIQMLPDSSSVLFIGAGGSVDFAAGSIRRAPRFIQLLLLEGFYRFFKEPSYKRAKRLITSILGVILFCYDATTKKMIICSRQ